ncbi:MAG: hypothetical protein MRY74_02675 [Neomegalonema sp.]|nr:hypothetical protein [Neomegalonema sp.]
MKGGKARALMGAAIISVVGMGDARANYFEESTLEEVRRALFSLCRADFSDRIDGDCSVAVKSGSIIVRRQERTAPRRAGSPAVTIETKVAYGPASYFFCGETEASTKTTPLFVSCDFEQAALGPSCVQELRTEERPGEAPELERWSTPIATLIDTTPKACEALSRALNRLVDFRK